MLQDYQAVQSHSTKKTFLTSWEGLAYIFLYSLMSTLFIFLLYHLQCVVIPTYEPVCKNYFKLCSMSP